MTKWTGERKSEQSYEIEKKKNVENATNYNEVHLTNTRLQSSPLPFESIEIVLA